MSWICVSFSRYFGSWLVSTTFADFHLNPPARMT